MFIHIWGFAVFRLVISAVSKKRAADLYKLVENNVLLPIAHKVSDHSFLVVCDVCIQKMFIKYIDVCVYGGRMR